MRLTGLAALALALAAPLAAKDAPLPTVQTLADRAEIEDLLTRYYNNFGGGVEDKIGEFYAEDGEMILGKTTYKGIAAIKGAYAAVPKDAPQTQRLTRSTS